MLSLKAVIPRHLAAGWQCPALGGHTLYVAA
jgi:hypothetical protein